jgi:hypothetical protein
MTWGGIPPYPRSVARDDELRKVAEDIRALARSLARDFREAVDQQRAGGHAPGEAVKRGLKNVAEEAKQGVKDTWADLGPFGGPCVNKHWQREWARHNRYKTKYARYGSRYWSPPAPPPGVPGSPPGEPVGGVAVQSPPGPPAAPGWARPPRPHRRRSSYPPVRRRWDGTTVLAVLAVLFGLAWMFSAMHAIHVSFEGVVAVGLMLLGAAMIVTGRTDWSLSRKSWPVWLGLGLILLLIATSSTFGIGSGVRNVSFGDKTVIAENGQSISGGFGTLTVNATKLNGGGHITVANIAGVIRINLPPDVQTDLNARVAAGQICAAGLHRGDGLGASTHLQIPPSAVVDGSPPVLHVNVHETSGEILVGGPGCNR